MPAAPTAKKNSSESKPGLLGRLGNRTLLNFWLDLILLLNLCTLIAVAAILKFVFPAPSAALDYKLWGANYQQWLQIQFNVLAALTLGVLLHVMLHWNWVCGVLLSKYIPGATSLRDEGGKTLWGVGLLALLCAFLAAICLAARLMLVSPG